MPTTHYGWPYAHCHGTHQRSAPLSADLLCRVSPKSDSKYGQFRVSLSVKCACHRTDLLGGWHNCYTVFGENRTDCVVCDTTSQMDGWTWSACKSLSLCKERLNLSTEFNSHSQFKTDQPFSEIWNRRAREGGGDCNMMAARWHWRLCVSAVILGEVCGSYCGAAAWLTNSHTLRQADGVGEDRTCSALVSARSWGRTRSSTRSQLRNCIGVRDQLHALAGLLRGKERPE